MCAPMTTPSRLSAARSRSSARLRRGEGVTLLLLSRVEVFEYVVVVIEANFRAHAGLARFDEQHLDGSPDAFPLRHVGSGAHGFFSSARTRVMMQVEHGYFFGARVAVTQDE